MIKPNVQVSDPYGPDAIEGTPDDDPKAQNETVIATSPTTTGLLLVGANDESAGQAGLYRNYALGFMTSTDRGLAWNHDISRSYWSGPPGNLPEPDSCFEFGGWLNQQLNPGAAIGGSGYMYLVGSNRDNDEPWRSTIFFARQHESTPAPPEWERCNEIPGTCPGAGNGGVGNPAIAADRSIDPARGDRVYAVWERGHIGGTAIEFTYSQNSGQEWLDAVGPQPVQLATGGGPGAYNVVGGPTLAVGPDGDVYAAWLDAWSNVDPNDPLDSRIGARKSIDFGQSFGQAAYTQYFNEISSGETQGSAIYYVYSYPAIAVDCSPCAARGIVYIAFADEGPTLFGQSDVMVTRSIDAGGNWEPAVNLISGDPLDNDQFFPAIAVDDYGRVGAIWVDKREDPANTRYHVYFRYSDDGGVTWSQNYRVSDAESDPHEAGDPTAVWDLGDSIGLAAQHDTFYGVFTDLHNWDGLDPVEAGDVYLVRIRISVPDFDHDCDIDLDDFGVLSACYNGSGRPPAPSCPDTEADLDGDGDVDLDDFGIFAGCYTGPAVCWCPQSGAAAASGPEGFEAPTVEDPTTEMLYRMLEEYCREHGVLFP